MPDDNFFDKPIAKLKIDIEFDQDNSGDEIGAYFRLTNLLSRKLGT